MKTITKKLPSGHVFVEDTCLQGMVEGPAAGLALVDELEADGRLRDHHRLHVVRGHLLERSGDRAGARAELLEAARRTTSTPERHHLERRAADLA